MRNELEYVYWRGIDVWTLSAPKLVTTAVTTLGLSRFLADITLEIIV